MRIRTIDIDDDSKELCDIQVVLTRRFAASDDVITAAQYRRLLEICEALEQNGPDIELIAWLQGCLQSVELMLPLQSIQNAERTGTLRLWTDWYDHGEVVDGLPSMHWRIQVWITDGIQGRLRREMRPDSTAEAARLLLSELGSEE